MESTPEATNFIMFQPDNGRPIPKKKNNRKVIYDNDAIYVAILYDDEPDKIRKEISQRDSFGISDVLAFLSMALMMVSKISSFCQRC
jgi:hypothetical protein